MNKTDIKYNEQKVKEFIEANYSGLRKENLLQILNSEYYDFDKKEWVRKELEVKK